MFIKLRFSFQFLISEIHHYLMDLIAYENFEIKLRKETWLKNFLKKYIDNKMCNCIQYTTYIKFILLKCVLHLATCQRNIIGVNINAFQVY